MDGLLANGLVERIETDRYAEARITAVGRALVHEFRGGDHPKGVALAIGSTSVAAASWLQSLPALHDTPLAFQTEGTAAGPA